MSIRQGDDIISGNGSGLPKQTGKAGKYLKTDGITVSWEDASTTQIWIGTKAEYDSLESYDDSIVYQIIDDYVDIKPINKNASRSIGELVYSTVPIIDAGLHLADGALLDGDGLYNEFYEYMVSVYNNGHTSIFTTENIWQISINTYGKCGKYVLDTTNHTIRLPKLSGFIEGTLNESEIGDLVEAGLPNITGGLSIPATYGSASASGAVSVTNTGTTGSQSPVSKSGDLSITLNASRSSSIYGNSTTVQPESIKTYIYVVLANSIENIIELNVINELNNKADINLANTAAITNCITKIPQDIKLELNNGTLTLKAGSKVYVPNGAGVFDVFNVSSDYVSSSTGANQTMVCCYIQNTDSIGFRPLSNCTSGANATATMGYVYDTTTNKIRFFNSSGVVQHDTCSFPIAIVKTDNNGLVASIDQVFNGFGYIGSTVFALPGVKGLIPNGRNADGSLKNTEFVISNVQTYTQQYTQTAPHYIVLNANSIQEWDSVYWIGYNAEKNIVYNKNGSASATIGEKLNVCICGVAEHIGSAKITSFTSKTAFRALDYNDSEYIAHQAMPSLRYIDLTLGASGATYTAPADGYFHCSSEGVVNILLSNQEFSLTITGAAGFAPNGFMPVRKGEHFSLVYSSNQNNRIRFYYAQGAQ